ncbi:SsrA-binding protein SmpB [Oceanispirochaeta crateris]|uniref:SsrA-binding protein n=1 Tax=Oceanispirochaeta crateris TaxID=2518645 RepID=A0A5C1QHR2_9SPIO|nr:SsrA-binding protein SmpB [Oceanispirochaeta crateris]QEN07673.1 SsrA-binding protein SmpB [Oceanispirochaeta crateris]
MSKKKKTPSNVLGENRKARHNYTISESIECGIVLKGTEVKSIKIGKFSFPDSFCEISNGELYIKNLQITPYDFGNINNHHVDGVRKLLAHKMEINKLERKIVEKGFTLIPLKFYLKNGRVKVDVGVCKGKKMYDKRATIKEKDIKRDTERVFRIK